MSRGNRYTDALNVLHEHESLIKLNAVLWLRIREHEEATCSPIELDEGVLFSLVKDDVHTATRLKYTAQNFALRRGWGEILVINNKPFFASNELLAEHPELLDGADTNGESGEKQTMIYAFRIKGSPDIKVGMTTQSFEKRLRNIISKSEAPDEAIELVLFEKANKNECEPIKDFDVHKELKRMGIMPISTSPREWFRATDAQVKEAFSMALLKKQLKI